MFTPVVADKGPLKGCCVVVVVVVVIFCVPCSTLSWLSANKAHFKDFPVVLHRIVRTGVELLWRAIDRVVSPSCQGVSVRDNTCIVITCVVLHTTGTTWTAFISTTTSIRTRTRPARPSPMTSRTGSTSTQTGRCHVTTGGATTSTEW